MNSTVRAVLAEDEPVLARGLARSLRGLWPQLHLDSIVHDGRAAVEAALTHLPDLLLLDIRMPELSGLEAARHVVDDWPEGRALPLLVFITAFDRFAIEAFEAGAIDYVLKPVEPARLRTTVSRLQARMTEREGHTSRAIQSCHQLERHAGHAPLRHIQAAHGNSLHLVPIEAVRCLIADDKYVQVHTSERVWLIRTPMRELASRLSPDLFVQIHRGCIVRWNAIDRIERDDSGRLCVHLAGLAQALWVSRSHAHHFRAM
ncbi:LytTR family DNA-binding domain-containing protein [Aquabacterium sp. A3]|uniref:LytR/AlgR family response regulator transcription factor n=1 Tax=Aquabacterium sp. A3 TaxID=3132829 RepID=UPI003119383D